MNEPELEQRNGPSSLLQKGLSYMCQKTLKKISTYAFEYLRFAVVRISDNGPDRKTSGFLMFSGGAEPEY